LERLAGPTREALEVAAIVGHEFGLALVAAALGRPQEALADPLGEAAGRSLVYRLRGSPERYAFTHALVAESLLEAVSPPRRAELHRRVGAALASMRDTRAAYAELSRHYRQAALQDAERALEYAVLAGDEATADYGFSEACEHYEAALEALRLVRPGALRERC